MAACLALVGALASPRDAWALPSPVVMVVAGELLLQVVLLLVLLVPVMFSRLRGALFRLLPDKRARSLAAAGAVALVLAVSAGWHRHTMRVPLRITPALADRLAACQALDPEVAAQLDLPGGSVILDPRPPAAFAGYHLIGSCNFSRAEFLSSKEVQQRLAGVGKEVYVIDDGTLSIDEFLGNATADGGRPRVQVLPDGLRRAYEGRHGERQMGWGKAPRLVVDGNGRSIHVQLGPAWFMGPHTHLPAPASGWRALGASAIAHTRARGVPIVLVNAAGSAAAAVPTIPAWNAFPETFDRLFPGGVREVLFVCPDTPQCLAAEALALQLADRGTRALGYVVGDEATVGATQPYLSPAASRRAVAGLLLLWALGVPLAAAGIRLLASRVGRSAGMIAAGRACALPVTAAAAISIAWKLSAMLTDEAFASNWHTTAVGDVSGAMLTAALAVVPFVTVGFIYVVERDLGHSSSWLKLAGLAAIVPFVAPFSRFGCDIAFLPVSLLVAATITVASAALFAPGTLAWLAARWGRRDAAVLPLWVARTLPEAGLKAAALSRSAADGVCVPAAVLVRTRPEVFLGATPPSVEKRVRRVLGRVRLAVRSTAPGEDAPGALTAGRYHSVLNVAPGEVDAAVRAVLHAYVDKGISPARPVSVLVQQQVEGRWAGVAMREPRHRGGGLVVEASARTNVSITSGAQAERRDRIGRFCRSWLLDAMSRREVPARALLELFGRLEPRLGADAEIEWSYPGRRLLLLQVREAPHVSAAGDGPAMTDAVQVLEELGPHLRWLQGRPTTPVLAMGSLTEMQPASRATAELLRDLWGAAGPARPARRLLSPIPFTPTIEPPIVRIRGALYENLCVSFAQRLLVLPVVRSCAVIIRLRARSLLARLEDRLRTEMDRARHCPVPVALLPPDQAAAQVLDARQRLLGGGAELAIAIASMERLLVRRQETRTPESRGAGDPFLSALAEGVPERTLADQFPWRCSSDLALERPRLGEKQGRALDDLVLTAQAQGLAEGARDGAKPVGESASVPARLEWLRGRARVLLAFHACGLRAAYLTLARATGRDDVFAWPKALLTRVAAGGAVEHAVEALPENFQPPVVVTLAGLEAWAAKGSPSLTSARTEGCGLWVSPPQRIAGRIVSSPALGTRPGAAAGEAGSVRPGELRFVVVGVPTAELVAGLPAGWGIIAAGGTSLCHAALVARQRGLVALFGAGSAASHLAPGDAIEITPSGRIRAGARPKPSLPPSPPTAPPPAGAPLRRGRKHAARSRTGPRRPGAKPSSGGRRAHPRSR